MLSHAHPPQPPYHIVGGYMQRGEVRRHTRSRSQRVLSEEMYMRRYPAENQHYWMERVRLHTEHAHGSQR